MKRKTATIERYHIFGTMRHGIRALYRGVTLRWHEKGYSVRADAPYYGTESSDAMRQHAKRLGFTHCRFIGDWSKAAKPRGGAL